MIKSHQTEHTDRAYLIFLFEDFPVSLYDHPTADFSL